MMPIIIFFLFFNRNLTKNIFEERHETSFLSHFTLSHFRSIFCLKYTPGDENFSRVSKSLIRVSHPRFVIARASTIQPLFRRFGAENRATMCFFKTESVLRIVRTCDGQSCRRERTSTGRLRGRRTSSAYESLFEICQSVVSSFPRERLAQFRVIYTLGNSTGTTQPILCDVLLNYCVALHHETRSCV